MVRQAAPPFEPRMQALRTRRTVVPVLGAAAEDAPALFEVPENFFLRSSGVRGDFYKVDLDEGRFAFVRAADVEATTGVVRFSALPESPSVRYVEPAVEVRLDGPRAIAGGDEAVVAGQVRFAGHVGDARRKVLIFRGNDKVYFWTRKGPTAEAVIPVDARIRLTPGRNDIIVYAIEGKDRTAIRRFSVFEAASRADAGGTAR